MHDRHARAPPQRPHVDEVDRAVAAAVREQSPVGAERVARAALADRSRVEAPPEATVVGQLPHQHGAVEARGVERVAGERGGEGAARVPVQDFDLRRAARIPDDRPAVLAGADEPAAGRVEGDVVDGAAVAAGDRAERAVVEVEEAHRPVLAADRRRSPVPGQGERGGERPDRLPRRLREATQDGERRRVPHRDAVESDGDDPAAVVRRQRRRPRPELEGVERQPAAVLVRHRRGAPAPRARVEPQQPAAGVPGVGGDLERAAVVREPHTARRRCRMAARSGARPGRCGRRAA